MRAEISITMNQYRHTGIKIAAKPVVAVPQPSIAQLHLTDVVARLSAQTELQNRQIRRLTSELETIKETMSRRS